MRTYPIKDDPEVIFAFEIDAPLLGSRVAKLLRRIDGVSDVRCRKWWVGSPDVHIRFRYRGLEHVSLAELERALFRHRDMLGLIPLTLSLVALALVGCRAHTPVARYLVTESPIDVGVGTGLCLAVDPLDEHGIWWWQPGPTGCASRSTGPGVFHAAEGRVSRSTPEARTAVAFRLGTHSTTRPFVDVRLVVEDGSIRALDTGARATLQRRDDLEVPEMPAADRR